MKHIDAAFPGRAGHVRLEPGGASFRCAPGQSVLAAALAAGIDLPYECASGSCGSCRARLLDGQVASLWDAAPGLSERDRRKGDRILCCQSVAIGDCVVQVRPGLAPVPVSPGLTQARVVKMSRLNEDVLHLTLAINVPFVFLPGQFVVFNLPAPIGRRAYSMSNLPGEQGTLEFMIKRKPLGLATGYLFERSREGDTLSVEGPYGRAFLRNNLNDDRDIVLLAGGSGLAPVWSIGLGALKEGAARRVRLYFGVNTSSDLFWLDEMQSARLKHPNLEVNVVLMQSSDADPPGCRVGMVAAILAQDLDAALDADLYMAGPPGLIDFALREFVTTGRMRADRVYFDRFC